MFTKILIANRGENGREADVSAKPNCLVRAAHAREFPAGARHVQ
jgi:hypothetical protein